MMSPGIALPNATEWENVVHYALHNMAVYRPRDRGEWEEPRNTTEDILRETIRLALMVQIQQHQDANLEPEHAIEMLPSSPVWRTLFAGMWALQKHKHRLYAPLEVVTPYKTMLDQCGVGRDEFLKVWSTFEGPHRMKSSLIPSPSWQGSMAQCVAVYGWSLRDYVFDSSVPSLSDLCPSTWAYFEASRSLNVPPTAQDMALLCSTPEPSGLSSYGLPENTLEPI